LELLVSTETVVTSRDTSDDALDVVAERLITPADVHRLAGYFAMKHTAKSAASCSADRPCPECTLDAEAFFGGLQQTAIAGWGLFRESGECVVVSRDRMPRRDSDATEERPLLHGLPSAGARLRAGRPTADTAALARTLQASPVDWFPQGFVAERRAALANTYRGPVVVDRLTVSSIAELLEELAATKVTR
jgi:hypothetical protein